MKCRMIIFLLFMGSTVCSAAMTNIILGWNGDTLKGSPCVGDTSHAYGPFDYINPDHYQKKLGIVEKYHFTRNVQQLVTGESGAYPEGDLNYTLMSFPNHHKALFSMIQFDLKKASLNRKSIAMPVECYLQRAIIFAPYDGTVKSLYGLFLHKKGLMDFIASSDADVFCIQETKAHLEQLTKEILLRSSTLPV